MENVLEALKKHSKQKSTKIRQFFNLCGVVVYNIVDGPSKLLGHLLPYLKTKIQPKIRQFFNLCGVVVYNIVDGPSKLLSNLLPYLKTKKKRIDYNICEAVNDSRALTEIDM